MTTTLDQPAEHTAPVEQSADAFAERVFASALGTIEILSIHLGDRLGWYRSLAQDGPATAGELARRTGTDPRYAREWLEQQAVFGILVTDASEPAERRRFVIPAAAAEVLTASTSLAHLGPVARMLTASAVRMPELLDAYRTGGGVSWDQFGDDMRTAQAEVNRPWFESRLAAAYRDVPELDSLLSSPGARVAEVGFGGGWAAIGLATAYPGLRVDGFEVDAPSVEMATQNAREHGVADRVTFHLTSGAEMGAAGTYDAAFAYECIHDMAQPVPVLAAMRAAVGPGAPVVVMEEAVAESFTAPGDDLERFMYGCSILICLPDGRSGSPSVATGTVIRPATLEAYAREAGFSAVDLLPIEDFGFWRFYALRG